MNKDTLNSNDSEHVSTATEIHTDELNIQMTRRRLLKGAAFGAPVILTLRSGALMAAGSCTGIKSADGIPTSSDDHCVTATPGGTTGAGKTCPENQIPSIQHDCGLAQPFYDTNSNVTSYTCTCPADSSYTYKIVLSSAAYNSISTII